MGALASDGSHMARATKSADPAEQAFRETYAARLNAAMKLRGVNQKRLAQLLDVNAPQVSDWQHAKRTITAPYIKATAKALKVTSDYLLGLSDEMSEQWEPTGETVEVVSRAGARPRGTSRRQSPPAS